MKKKEKQVEYVKGNKVDVDFLVDELIYLEAKSKTLEKKISEFQEKMEKEMGIIEYRVGQNSNEVYDLYRLLQLKLTTINTKLDELIEEKRK